MSVDVWIEIPEWRRFQHYRDRNPNWIKNYPELLSKDEYLALSFHARGVLHGLWMEYARSNGQLRGGTVADSRQLRDGIVAAPRQLRGSFSAISRQLGGRVTAATLVSLNHAGFIRFSASKPLASRYQAASNPASARATRANALAREGSKEPSKTRARASDPQAARALAADENGAAPEPEVDPEALAKLRAIQKQIGRPLGDNPFEGAP